VRKLALLLLIALPLAGDTLPFLSDKELAALASEVSGETAKRNLEGLARQHRMRGSRGFRSATDLVIAELKRYGYADAHVESFPTDGKIFYGTQRSRPAWNAEFAELWELDGNGAHGTRIASWEASPISLAQDSVSGDVTAELIDVGAGSADADYKNKDVRGKIVLASAQPGPVAAKALARGAVGIVSYAQNQRTAWYGENDNLVRWGHLETFSEDKTFAFMVSLKTARALQQRLGSGATIRLHAKVIAGQENADYNIATATIPGSEPGEIVFSCHLDHPRPGANDNASGCASILEAARMLSKLIAEKRLAPPRRTIRFVWPPEVEGTLALLNGRPQLAKNIRAAVHLDMVGGGPETKAIFHVTRGPASQPSFVYDLADSVALFVNEQTEAFAKTGTARFPLIAGDGSKDPLRAELAPFSGGSDHQVYSDSSFGIPAIYLNDWPDRYIHTNLDIPANIDSTKLARAAFIAAASGYALATITTDDAPALQKMMEPFALERRARAMRRGTLPFSEWYERGMRASVDLFFRGEHVTAPRKVKGTMSAFGYDYFADRYTGPAIRLDPDSHYEALNLWDGRRTDAEIRDMLSAIYAPVPLEDVTQYLDALGTIGVIPRAGTSPSK
jgi:aminopeptidase YwaD